MDWLEKDSKFEGSLAAIPEPSPEVKELPYYCPPDSARATAARIPLWTWRLRMRAQWTKLTKKLVVSANTSAQDVFSMVETKTKLLHSAVLKLCAPPPIPTRGLNELFKIEGSTDSTYQTLFLRVTKGDQSYIQLQALLQQALQAPADETLMHNLYVSYDAWNPMESIIKVFFALFRSEEGKWMPWTAQDRWKDMKRPEVLQEWNLILEDPEFVSVYDTECFTAAVLCLRGSMALQPMYAATLRRRRRALKKLAENGDGAGAGAAGPVFSIKSSLFYCVIAEIEDMEDLYEYKMSHLPLSAGWVETPILTLTTNISKGQAEKPETRLSAVALSALDYGL